MSKERFEKYVQAAMAGGTKYSFALEEARQCMAQVDELFGDSEELEPVVNESLTTALADLKPLWELVEEFKNHRDSCRARSKVIEVKTQAANAQGRADAWDGARKALKAALRNLAPAKEQPSPGLIEGLRELVEAVTNEGRAYLDENERDFGEGLIDVAGRIESLLSSRPLEPEPQGSRTDRAQFSFQELCELWTAGSDMDGPDSAAMVVNDWLESKGITIPDRGRMYSREEVEDILRRFSDSGAYTQKEFMDLEAQNG